MDTVVNFHDTNRQPAQFLVDNTDLLARGRALDIAMGSGRNAVYLAKMGFEVEGYRYLS
jgi:tellurite methyltransferase